MPPEIKAVEGPDSFGPIMRIPEDIRPAMQLHRIEVSFFTRVLLLQALRIELIYVNYVLIILYATLHSISFQRS